MIHLITYENTKHPNLEWLKRTAAKYGWPSVTVLGQGDEWKGFGTKIFSYTKYIESLPENDVVVVVDARDVLVNGTVDQFLKEFETLPYYSLLVSAEFGCCSPGDPKVEAETRRWVESLSPNNMNRFLNSGMIAGRAKTFQQIYPFGMTRYDEDDQNSMTNYWIKNPNDIVLDYDETVFSNSTWSPNNNGYDRGDGRWISKHTHNSPIFIQTQNKAWKCYRRVLSMHFPQEKREYLYLAIAIVLTASLVVVWRIIQCRKHLEEA